MDSKTKTLVAKMRLNRSTLASLTPSDVLDTVKHRLAKALLEQILESGSVNIVSTTNPNTGATTFVASVDILHKDAQREPPVCTTENYEEAA